MVKLFKSAVLHVLLLFKMQQFPLVGGVQKNRLHHILRRFSQKMYMSHGVCMYQPQKLSYTAEKDHVLFLA